MLRQITVRSQRHREFLDITPLVNEIVAQADVSQGICLVFSQHTTASLTVNENADPAVQEDLLRAFSELLGDETRFRHAEGNSGGHALVSLTSPSLALPISEGALQLGEWQAIYMCEWDGPRQRTLSVQIVADR